jgi:hypothetical protein
LAVSSAERGPRGVLSALVHLRGSYGPASEVVPWRSLTLVVVACGFLYGAAMGGYTFFPEDVRPSAVRADTWRQALYSGVKVPLLVLVSTLVCLPSFYVLNAVLGLREDFAAACRGVFVGQATLTACLVSIAPITVFFYASGLRYSTAVVVNGVAFLAAAFGAQAAVARHYRPLIARNRRHLTALRAWLVLYLFVAVQCAWVLRPYVGAPTMATVFFRPKAWSNAYLVVADDVARQFTGR